MALRSLGRASSRARRHHHRRGRATPLAVRPASHSRRPPLATHPPSCRQPVTESSSVNAVVVATRLARRAPLAHYCRARAPLAPCPPSPRAASPLPPQCAVASAAQPAGHLAALQQLAVPLACAHRRRTPLAAHRCGCGCGHVQRAICTPAHACRGHGLGEEGERRESFTCMPL